MDNGILLNAFLNHAPSSQALALAYQNVRDSAFSSDSTDIPAFGALANVCQQPSNFAYIIMAGRPWPSGDAPLLPQWTPINGPRVDRAGAEIRALSYVHDNEQNAEAVVAPLAVWNERQDTPESTFLRDAARWRPADTIITDDTSYTKSTVEMRPPPTLTDDEIFAGGLKLLDNSSYLLQIAAKYRNQEILDKINAGYTDPLISGSQLGYRIKKALNEQARLEDRPRSEIKAELERARRKSGVTHRTHLEIGQRGSATRAAKKRKELDAGSHSLDMYGSWSTDGRDIVSKSRSTLEEVDEDEDSPLSDLEEMGRRVARGSLSSVAETGETQLAPVEKQIPKESQRMSSGGGSSEANKRKAYDYDRDGDTTDEETHAEQLSRFQWRKAEARGAAREAQVKRVLKRL